MELTNRVLQDAGVGAWTTCHQLWQYQAEDLLQVAVAMVGDRAMGSRARAKTAGDRMAVQPMDQQHLAGAMVRHITFISP